MLSVSRSFAYARIIGRFASYDVPDLMSPPRARAISLYRAARSIPSPLSVSHPPLTFFPNTYTYTKYQYILELRNSVHLVRVRRHFRDKASGAALRIRCSSAAKICILTLSPRACVCVFMIRSRGVPLAAAADICASLIRRVLNERFSLRDADATRICDNI